MGEVELVSLDIIQSGMANVPVLSRAAFLYVTWVVYAPCRTTFLLYLGLGLAQEMLECTCDAELIGHRTFKIMF